MNSVPQSQPPGLTQILQQAGAYVERAEHRAAMALLDAYFDRRSSGACWEEEEISALALLSDIQQRMGLAVLAYQNFNALADLATDNDARQHYNDRAIDNLARMTTLPQVTERLEQHLVSYINCGTRDHAAILGLTCEAIKAKYHFDDPDFPVTLEQLGSDALFMSALANLQFPDVALEQFVVALRSHVMAELTSQPPAPATVALATNLALHAYHNEYVAVSPRAELEVVDDLAATLEQCLPEVDGEVPVNLVCSLLLTIAMYRSLATLQCFEVLLAVPQEEWPECVAALVRAMLLEPLEEQQLLQKNIIGAEVSHANPVSNQVRAHYESNPYPRWRSLHVPATSSNYLDHYGYLRRTLEQTSTFEGQLRCLVAGCGTGLQPLGMTKQFNNLAITAVDLSGSSLGYALRMASALGITEVEFRQADILALDGLPGSFDLVECVGVLHHMADPLHALRCLRDKLRPMGLIKLGLYSKIARRDITKLRDANPHWAGMSDMNAIRSIRQELIATHRADNPPPALFQLRDFYSLSECRDLLFHSQERCYDIHQIETLLASAGFRFAGFQIGDPAVLAAWQQRYPNDPKRLNLENWHDFEQQTPGLFRGMYQFHAQRIESVS